MVGVGKRCRNCTACQLGVVELPLPGVAASDKDLQCGVTSTAPEPPFTQLVVARILVEQRREDAAYHEVLDGGVGVSGPVALCIALKALSEAGISIFSLIDARENAYVRELDGVEHSQGHQLEFLPGRERRDLFAILHRQVVWQGPEKAVILRALLFLDGGVLIIPTFRSRLGLAL